MGYGKRVDQVIGGFSRLLHVRPAKENTIRDLEEHYLDLSLNEMFVPPPVPIRPTMKRTLLDRAIRSSTVSWRSSHEVRCPRYQRRHDGPYRKNHTAQLRWVRPEGARREDCLIYVHGWLEPGSWAEETTLFRKWGRELGVDLAHVSLPFHGVRKPRSSLFSGEFFWTADLVRTIEGVRQAVHDTRCAITFLREQGYQRIGVTGLSLGGAITMLMGCLEPAPDFIIPIMGHLQLAEAVEDAPILWRMKHDLERWGIDREARRTLFDRLGWAHLAPVVPPDHQLWVEAKDDLYIGAELVRRQAREWNDPQVLWIDGGHMTFPLHVNHMTDRIAAFIRETRTA